MEAGRETGTSAREYPLMEEINYFKDPRPDQSDSRLWRLLFLMIGHKYDEWGWTRTDCILYRLWFFRSYGTILVAKGIDHLRLAPMLQPQGIWESTEEFNLFKMKFFLEFEKEISQLLVELQFLERQDAETVAKHLGIEVG